MQDVAKKRATIHFGEFELDHSGELRSQGRKVKLQEQPLQILRILMEQPGEIVTREELRKKIWQSDTFVDFDHGINNAIKRLREALGDTAETPRYIETLPRRGYRFLNAVASPNAEVSIAVLPFLSLSSDPDNEIFADGMCEEIISSLAQIKNLRVIARTSSFSFKGKHVDLRAIGEQLNVRTVLEGSVRKSGNRLKITVQLVNAADGYHLWSETYDREMKDVFAIQEEIATAIAQRLEVTVVRYEEAAAIGESVLTLLGRSVWMLGSLARTYAYLGRHADCQALYMELRWRSKREYVQPTALAWAACAAGEQDEAIRCIQEAHAIGDPSLLAAKYWPDFTELRKDSRFGEILNSHGWK